MRPRGRSWRLAIGIVGLLIVDPVATGSMIGAEPPPSAATQLVSGQRFDVARLPAATRAVTSRQRVNAALPTTPRTVRAGLLPASAPLRLDERMTADSPEPVTPPTMSPVTAATVTPGFSTMLYDSLDSVNQPPANGNGAALGNITVVGNSQSIQIVDTGGGEFQLYDFFAVPADEYYWGAVVGASLYRGRFVAVLPTFDGPAGACASGWLNIAVSSSADPRAPWTRYRIAMPDAWSSLAQVGVSDDKVVITANQFDLDPGASLCLGSTYEGARIRVVDWADLIDGGTLTVRDVTPGPATDYWGWLPATNVPVAPSTAAGTSIQLVASRFVGAWGHLAYASIGGSAKAGTAVVTGNVDLTVARSIRRLSGPPARVAAFPSGNGAQDERPISAAWRAGRLWMATNDQCMVAPDAVPRACTRYLELATTTTPPSKLQDADFGDAQRDTFLPLVGLARDGSTYFAMSASSAISHAPIVEYATYRLANVPMAGGTDETRIRPNTALFGSTGWGEVGSVIADPTDSRAAWAIYPGMRHETGLIDHLGTSRTRLKGGLTGAPGGTFKIDSGIGWVSGVNALLTFLPDPLSPIQWVRYAVQPGLSSTPGGPVLTYGTEVPSQSFQGVKLDAGGGTWPFTVYVQWRSQDGTWSAPITHSVQLDQTPPVFSKFAARFAAGTVSTTVPLDFSWAVSDAGTGIGQINLFYTRKIPSSSGQLDLPVTATHAGQQLLLGSFYRYQVRASDRAGNSVLFPPEIDLTAYTYQGSAAGLAYSGTWKTATSTSFLGGSTRYSTTAGAKFSYTFTGRAVAFISTMAATRGKASIWIDGTYVTFVDLYSATTKYRQIVWQTSWLSAGPHKMEIKVLSTPGRTRVDADAVARF
jgi:hypothetical protein